jgi:transmembrane sensor
MADDRDLIRQIAQAGARMDPGLSDRDVERLVMGAVKRRRQRRMRRAGLAGMVALAGSFALAHTLRAPTPASAPAPLAKAAPAPAPIDLHTLRLADGSTATALDSGTELSIVEDGNAHAALSLTRGRGRFNIVPRPTRALEVRAGDVSVTVLGTVFSVERVADRVGVAVESGTVRVNWRGGSAILQTGSTGWYPPLTIAENQEQQLAPTRVGKTPGRRLAMAQRGESLAASAPAKPETAEGLLAAADKARLAGRAVEGADLLRTLVRNHRNDARAPLAAFTLGRMLLMELGQPLEASLFFAEARRLSPQGPLAEDSMAREVESLAKAGESASARSRAKEYLRLYPDGRRAAAVRMISAVK